LKLVAPKNEFNMLKVIESQETSENSFVWGKHFKRQNRSHASTLRKCIHCFWDSSCHELSKNMLFC